MAKLGLALGGGGARGAAHVGAIRALEERGIVPDIVCGTSVGSLVGGAYVAGKLDEIEQWMDSLSAWRVLKTADIRVKSGGFLVGERVRKVMAEAVPDVRIEDLPKPYAAVATDLTHGREVWLQDGPLLDAVYASCAVPGLFAPFQRDHTWLTDGGLTNPVPISVCRALGAEKVIAIDLNRDVLNHMVPPIEPQPDEAPEPSVKGVWDWLNATFARNRNGPEAPALLHVATSAINIMQNRITAARMAGDPPDIVLAPRVGNVGILEYEAALPSIAEGRACVERAAAQIDEALR